MLGGVYATEAQATYAAENGISNPYITEAYEKAVAHAIPVDNAISCSADLNDIIRQQILTVAYGTQTPEESAAEAVALLNSTLIRLEEESY